jgi:hypothetical protein
MENKENKKAWFVKTQDEHTAKELMDFGFKLADNSNGTWTFINSPDKPLTFDDKKIIYSNKLVF